MIRAELKPRNGGARDLFHVEAKDVARYVGQTADGRIVGRTFRAPTPGSGVLHIHGDDITFADEAAARAWAAAIVS